MHAVGGRLSRRAVVGGMAVGVAAAGLALARERWPVWNEMPRMPRVGFTYSTPLDARAATRVEAFRAGLRDYGYAEEQNIQVLWRFSASQTGEDVESIIRELIDSNVDVLAISNTPPTQVAKRATSTIPIVGIYVGDPVALGLVDSLARPGGNVTALSAYNYGLMGKRLDLLRALAPGVTRVGFVFNLGNESNVANYDEFQQVAEAVGVTTLPIGLRTLDNLEPGLAEAVAGGIEAVVYTATGSIPPPQVFRSLLPMARQHRLPTLGFDRSVPDAGGLISVGVDILSVYRRAGYYVDRILKGSKPADLPVELPSVFEVVVNNATSQALGLTIPPEVAVQVTEWLN